MRTFLVSNQRSFIYHLWHSLLNINVLGCHIIKPCYSLERQGLNVI